MKKQNNRYRNNSNNGYTLNYKFDSVSPAGKISGTALELIRRYNDLAKEAQGGGNYVEMEIYRQYAEHYRKIVTDINEKKQSKQEQYKETENASAESTVEEGSEQSQNTEEPQPVEAVASSNGYVETLPASEPVKTFHVVEVKEEKENSEKKTKRVYHRKKPAGETAAPALAENEA